MLLFQKETSRDVFVWPRHLIIQRYFTGFDFPKDEDEPEKMNVNDILWERFFYCESLGQSLVPVVKAFLGSEQCKSNKPCEDEKDTDNYVKSWRPKKFAEPRFPVNKQITGLQIII